MDGRAPDVITVRILFSTLPENIWQNLLLLIGISNFNQWVGKNKTKQVMVTKWSQVVDHIKKYKLDKKNIDLYIKTMLRESTKHRLFKKK